MLKERKKYEELGSAVIKNWVWIREAKKELDVCSIKQKHLALVTE